MRIITQLKKIFIRKPKIIVILGATSTGKSDLAVEIAQKCNGEIISADSRQVYTGMNLGSGKITANEMQGIPHYLLDVEDPKNTFTVDQFQKLGAIAIKTILDKNKTPIICGGTGYYIDSLIHQTTLPKVPANKILREELESKSLSELQNILKSKKAKNIQHIDIYNKVRIIRALEIISALGDIPKTKKKKNYRVLFIGLDLPKDNLQKRIHTRIIKRLEMGMLDETKKLIKDGMSHQRLQSLGLEYRYMSKYLLGKIDYGEMIEMLYRDTLKFVKRQKTWFKKNKNIHWFNPITEKTKILKKVSDFLK